MENGGGTGQVLTEGTLAPGTMLDHYRLDRCAVHEVLQTPCAIKIIRPEVAKGSSDDAEALRIFKLLTELGAKTSINPPNYGGRTTLTDHTPGAMMWYRGTRSMEYLKYMPESGKFEFNPGSVVFAFERGNSAVLELLARKLPETDGNTARQILPAALRRKMPRKVIKPLLDRQHSPLPEEQLTEVLKGNYADVIDLFRGKISAAALSSLRQNADRRDSDKIGSGNGSAPVVNRRQGRRRK